MRRLESNLTPENSPPPPPPPVPLEPGRSIYDLAPPKGFKINPETRLVVPDQETEDIVLPPHSSAEDFRKGNIIKITQKQEIDQKNP